MIHQGGILTISRGRLRHNLELLRARAGTAVVCPVVKADAYGHGAGWVVREMVEAGVRWFCVYSLGEVAELVRREADLVEVLRQRGAAILVLAPVVVAGDESAVALGGVDELMALGVVRFNVVDARGAAALNGWAGERGMTVPVHVQVDTGLTRVGVLPEEVAGLAEVIMGMKHLRLEGVFTHFSHADVGGHATVAEQMGRFKGAVRALERRFPELMVHAQNSGGVWHLGDAGLDMVRVGIALYGLQPSTAEPIAGLQPIAQVTAAVLAVHERPAGVGVGYGHTFVTGRASRLAVVPVGYADGYPRGLSNGCVAQVRGVDVPVVGRVSMDQIILDVTDVAGVGVGEEVVVISWDPLKANSLDRMADAIGTIGYELATRWGGRLKRVVVE